MNELKAHPVYKNYGATKGGEVYNIKKHNKLSVRKDRYGYIYVSVKGSRRLARFVYECFYGLIEHGLVIDHKNSVRHQDNIDNLQKITQSANVKKRRSVPIIERRRVEAKNGDVSMSFKSLTKAGKFLGICEPSVRRVCEGTQKTAIAKNGDRIIFKYV